MTSAKGLAEFAHCHEVSLYRGTFPYILLLLESTKLLVIPIKDFVIWRFVILRFHCSTRMGSNKNPLRVN